ncbi:MAG: adenylate/guanylate cyclase domain-containing protein [Deltaproteobacteria bacterium]|nr:adenylate/guanylate cyclase domain-containing protein [Deltaproteobacteria bacterium]
MCMIRTLDVNRSTLDLYEADGVAALAGGFENILGERSREILVEELIALSGGEAFEMQCVNRTMTGKEINVLMKASIPPGYETTWSRVLLTVHDLSERMRAEFLKDMFGRYLSEEVTNTLLENPDLRGFTSLAERLEPEQVVQLLNTYFEVMVDVLGEYSATINEIVGDSLLVIFGAPQAMADRAQRAVASMRRIWPTACPRSRWASGSTTPR